MITLDKILITIILIFSLAVTPAFAAANTQYADTLYELGLFKGTENGYELENTLTREQAATVLVRILGEESKLETFAYTQTFDDVSSDRWSYSYVMYCYENDITKGTGEDMFSPEAAIDARQFVTLVLRLMGYTDAEPDTALDIAVQKGLFNSAVAKELDTNEKFLRDDMVYIVYRSLMTKTNDGDILACVLADKGVITEKEAAEFDIYESSEDINELLDRLFQ